MHHFFSYKKYNIVWLFISCTWQRSRFSLGFNLWYSIGAAFFNIEAPLLTHDEQLRLEPGYYFQARNTIANPPDHVFLS